MTERKKILCPWCPMLFDSEEELKKHMAEGMPPYNISLNQRRYFHEELFKHRRQTMGSIKEGPKLENIQHGY